MRHLPKQKTALLIATTGVDLVDKWQWIFFQLAFPFSLPRVVGGADFPRQERQRRDIDSQILDPWEYQMQTMEAV